MEQKDNKYLQTHLLMLKVLVAVIRGVFVIGFGKGTLVPKADEERY